MQRQSKTITAILILTIIITNSTKAEPPAFDSAAFSHLSAKDRTAFILSSLQWREEQLQDFEYTLKYSSVAMRDGIQEPGEDGMFVIKRKGEKNLMTAHLTFHSTHGSGSTSYQESWDGTIHKNLTMPDDKNLRSGAIWDNEARTLRMLSYNQMLGFRVPEKDKAETLPVWIADTLVNGQNPTTVEEARDHNTSLVKFSVTTNGYLHHSYWFDPTRDYMPTRYELNHADQTTVYARTEISVDEAKQVDGLWVPFKVSRVTTKGTGPIGGKFSYEVLAFNRGPVNDSDVDIQFPPGLTVTDTVKQKAYRVDKDGKLEEVEYYDLATGEVKYPKKNATQPSEAAPKNTDDTTQPAK